MSTTDLGFAPNYTNLFLLNLTPSAATPTWGYIGPGISSIEADDDEETSDDSYYDGGGVASNDVTSIKAGYKFDGNRKYGDPVQDYVAGLRYETGSARIAHLRHIAPNGEIEEGEVTIQDITAGGGDANDKGAFSFSAYFNGRPEFTEGDKTQFPDKVTAQAVTVQTGKTANASLTVTPETASPACVYAIEDDAIATVDQSGIVTGVKQGKTKLSIKCVAKPSIRTVVDVTVS